MQTTSAQKLDQIFCLYFLFPANRVGVFKAKSPTPAVWFIVKICITSTSDNKRGVHYDTKHTWGKENRPLYCGPIISLVFQTRINVSWCSCIVLIWEKLLLTLLLNHRLCCPMWGNAGEGLWLLLSCKVKGRWLMRAFAAHVLLDWIGYFDELRSEVSFGGYFMCGRCKNKDIYQ